jgi:diaminopimelate decarboxylase
MATAPAMTLYDKVRGMPAGVLHDVCGLAGGACYVVDPEMVGRNVSRLREAMRRVYGRSEVAYSYKANYGKAVIAAARAAGALSEVVSLLELAHAGALGIPDREILCNGPGKTEAMLRELMAREFILIADSVAELERMQALVRGGVRLRARLGLRINPRLSHQRGPSRFGVDLGDADQLAAVRTILAGGGLPLCGLHLHLSDDRSVAGFGERIDFLADAWGLLGGGPLEFLDCGGGLASGMPEEVRKQLPYAVAALEEYGVGMAAAMKRRFPDEDVTLYCEPGTGLVADTGVFLTRVEDVKMVGGRSLAVVDSTFFCANPMRTGTRPACFRVPAVAARQQVPPPVTVYGNSCMDLDRWIEGFEEPLAVGDLLILAQKGAYALSMSSMFIQGIPAIVSLEGETANLLRPRSGVELLGAIN